MRYRLNQAMSIPKALILFRLLLAPIILLLAYYIGNQSNSVIVILMYLGLLSDIFDGIIARKQGLSTEKLRRLDSQVDLVFWLSIGFATWILFPEIIKTHRLAIISIIVLEGLCYCISFIKFKKEACTHAFLSKLWGISLLITFTSLIGFGYAGIPFKITIILGILSQVDVILILLILKKWTHDIPSAYHAYLIRNEIPFKKHPFLNS